MAKHDKQDTGSKVKSLFVWNNPVYRFMADSANYPGRLTPEEDRAYAKGEFNPIDAVKGTEWDKPEYLEKLVDAKSQREVDWMTGNLKRYEKEDANIRETMGMGSVEKQQIRTYEDSKTLPKTAGPKTKQQVLRRSDIQLQIQSGDLEL